MNRHVTLYHWPQSRSAGAYTLLEELKADFSLEIVDIREGKHKKSPYMQVNPMGKVPTIRHGDAIVTEQVAVYIYLADLYLDRGLAPALDDPLRGPYLRWMAFYAGSFEPAIVDKALKREPGPPSMMPYGDFETMWGSVSAQLSRGPYMLGDRFTALDVLWGAALAWMHQFQLLPAVPDVTGYIKRVTSRPSFVKVAAENAKIMEKQGS